MEARGREKWIEIYEQSIHAEWLGLVFQICRNIIHYNQVSMNSLTIFDTHKLGIFQQLCDVLFRAGEVVMNSFIEYFLIPPFR